MKQLDDSVLALWCWYMHFVKVCFVSLMVVDLCINISMALRTVSFNNMDIGHIIILDREYRWYERGVKEAMIREAIQGATMTQQRERLASQVGSVYIVQLHICLFWYQYQHLFTLRHHQLVTD